MSKLDQAAEELMKKLIALVDEKNRELDYQFLSDIAPEKKNEAKGIFKEICSQNISLECSDLYEKFKGFRTQLLKHHDLSSVLAEDFKKYSKLSPCEIKIQIPLLKEGFQKLKQERALEEQLHERYRVKYQECTQRNAETKILIDKLQNISPKLYAQFQPLYITNNSNLITLKELYERNLSVKEAANKLYQNCEAQLEKSNQLTAHISEKEDQKSLPSPSTALSKTSVAENPLSFMPASKRESKDVAILLTLVADGQQAEVEKMIKANLQLLTAYDKVQDLAGRTFTNITAFQYALWSLDWHMWAMIQKYLPKEEQAKQLQELETKGTAYGKHFSLKGLIDALQEYVDKAPPYGYHDYSPALNLWYKVGGQQKLLPVSVVNEYCRLDRTFHPCPREWESKLPRTCAVSGWDNVQKKYVSGSWFRPFSAKDALGLNYAFHRGFRYYGAAGSPSGEGSKLPLLRNSTNVWEPEIDLKALRSLWKTRTRQLDALKSELLHQSQTCLMM
ncbi:MAG: hypothetical protein JSR33_09110 [Proteobacteria bacterium]|nr:hypothetical protein [Pseudomonadota bacterium]